MNNLAYAGKVGLMGMQERARLLGITLDVQSQLGKGTTVALEGVPLGTATEYHQSGESQFSS